MTDDLVDDLRLMTCNQVVGSVRLMTTRTTDQSCSWKFTSALNRYRLDESLEDACYGSALTDEPYGPWWDPARWTAQRQKGEERFFVDLGRDPEFARRRVRELRRDGFIDENTRKIVLSATVYNNALPMLCFTRVTVRIKPTGIVTSISDVQVRRALLVKEAKGQPAAVRCRVCCSGACTFDSRDTSDTAPLCSAHTRPS